MVHPAPDGKPTPVKILEPGEIFGEMAIVEHTIQIDNLEILGIDGGALERLRKTFSYSAAKLLLDLSRIIGGWLRKTTEKLTHAPDA